MMARSTRSNQRPDTLMQDRICQIDENLLQRTAGPYSWVTSGGQGKRRATSGLSQTADVMRLTRCSARDQNVDLALYSGVSTPPRSLRLSSLG
jgi:hypothetical protein